MNSQLENILYRNYKTDMISYMESHPEVFDEAIHLALGDKPTFSWRAAWLLWSCMDEDDPRVKKHTKSIINVLPEKNDNHQRELLKILQNLELDEEFEGVLFDICTGIWEKISKKPSVRHNAFRMLVKIAKKHPILSKEVLLLTQNHYLESLSPGVQNSILKMIKELA